MDDNAKSSPFALLTTWWLWPIICFIVVPPMEAAVWQLVSGLSHSFLVGTLALGAMTIITAALGAHLQKQLLKALAIGVMGVYLSFIGYAVTFHYQEPPNVPVSRSAIISGSGATSASVTIVKPSHSTLSILLYVGIVQFVIVCLLYILWRRRPARADLV